jgi:hypothetical protein
MADDEVVVEMFIAPDTIGIDEQAFLSITVKGSEQNLPDPEMPNLAMFEVSSQGTSTNLSIVNGQVESSQTYNYMLFPRKQGTFVIKPAVVVHNRKRYESGEVTLTVLDSGVGTPQSTESAGKTQSGETRDVFLVAELNKNKVYVNEQVTLTIKFCHAVRLLSQPDYTPPQTTDFWADMLEPQRTYYQNINGRRYSVIELNTALFPTRSGELTIGSAMASVTVRGQQRRSRDPFSMFDNFFDRGVTKTVRSRPLTLNVLPLPSQGKPVDFSGTVGDFEIVSSVDKTSVDVNQPVTVTYKIRGTGNIKTVAEPAIEDLPDFRIYRASSDEKISKIDGIVGGTKVFEETYIPKRAGQLTIPPVSLDFFNPATKKYRTISTKAITLNVSQPALGEYADIPVPQVPGRIIDPKAKDIRYIKSDPGHLAPARSLILFSPLYLILNGIPFLILVSVFVAQKKREKLASDIGYARSRRAKKMARKRLAKARKMAGSAESADFFAEIRLALFAFVADKLNISPHGMTSDNLLDILNERSVDESMLDKIKDILRRADFAQYSSSQVSAEDIQSSLKSAEEILVGLEGIKFE